MSKCTICGSTRSYWIQGGNKLYKSELCLECTKIIEKESEVEKEGEEK